MTGIGKLVDRDPLLSPFQLKGLKLKNRIVGTSHAPAYAEDGLPKLRYQLYHEEKAKGGIGLVGFGGSSFVSDDSPSVFGQLNVSDDRIIPYFEEFASRIHQHDCPLICQITHLGRRTTWSSGNWFPAVAPSRVKEPSHRAISRAMDKYDIRRIIGDYAAAAARCKRGGLDGCEIHLQGHLPGQFLSPSTNMRDDEYGGSLTNRLRFTLELLEAAREAVGPDFVLGVVHGGREGVENGITWDDGLEAAKRLEESGLIDYISVRFGHMETDHSLNLLMPGMIAPLAPRLAEVAKFRKELSIPLVHVGKIPDLATARYAIENNIIDLVGMTRAHIADPHIVRKLKEGRESEIRPCVGANHCADRLYFGGEALCIHNAATGREATMPHVISRAAGEVKTVVVVGAGPGGLEAARVSAERGHKVVLFEATGKLGGQVVIAAKAGWRRDLIGIVDWYEGELKRLGVDIRWNTVAGSTEILAEQPDIVIVATGGIPDTDFVPGGEHAISVWDVLSGKKIAGSVLIYDDNGQAQAASCADVLGDDPDVKLEFFTPDRAAFMELGALNYSIFFEHFQKKSIPITAGYRIKSIDRAGNQLQVNFSSDYEGPNTSRVVDHVIVERGTLPMDELYSELREASVNDGVLDHKAILQGDPQPALVKLTGDAYALFRVGDAVASRSIHAAIYDSLRLCKDF